MLTDRQVEVILVEQARFIAWLALRQTVKSQREIAREFGVSQATISLAVRSKGDYKQPSPEGRTATRARAQSCASPNLVSTNRTVKKYTPADHALVITVPLA